MIDFEKLAAKSQLEALGDYENYMESTQFDSDFAEWQKKKDNIGNRISAEFCRIFAVDLLKNYHQALSTILKSKGIDLDDF